jgi:hypothetical protein
MDEQIALFNGETKMKLCKQFISGKKVIMQEDFEGVYVIDRTKKVTQTKDDGSYRYSKAIIDGDNVIPHNFTNGKL